ncbi:MAG TPA: hypothetical protein VHU22_16430, partial [Xanthobacteraceae bacterium]|nr:hypothetical protein [Xanthobacteraceae bacterium]
MIDFMVRDLDRTVRYHNAAAAPNALAVAMVNECRLPAGTKSRKNGPHTRVRETRTNGNKRHKII